MKKNSLKSSTFQTLITTSKSLQLEQFLHEKYQSMALVDVEPSRLLEKFDSYEPPAVKTYINEKQI